MLEYPGISQYRKVTICDRCGQSAGKTSTFVEESSETLRRTRLLPNTEVRESGKIKSDLIGDYEPRPTLNRGSRHTGGVNRVNRPKVKCCFSEVKDLLRTSHASGDVEENLAICWNTCVYRSTER